MADVFMRVLSVSLSGALVALVTMALVALLGGQLPRAWRYYVWLIVLLRMLLPIAPQGNNLIDWLARQAVTTPTAQQQAVPEALPDTQGVDEGFAFPMEALWAESMDNELPPEPAAPPTDPAPAAARPALASILADLWQYAWVVWLGVALLLLLLVRIVTSYHSFTRFIRAGWKPVDDPDVLDLLDEVCAQRGVKRPLPLYLNPLATSPMLVGILRPVIVLPTVRLDREKLRYILAHELVHYKRQDILYKWLVQVVCCLHWFNPVIYWVKKDIGIACELSCDEKVLSRRHGADPIHYGDTLLAVMQTSGHYGDLVASVTMSEEGNMMKKRLQSIASPHRQSKVTVLISVMISALLLFGAAYAGAYTGTPAPEAVDSEPAADTTEADVSPSPTRTPTPGEKLDSFLGDMDAWAGNVGEQAAAWGGTVADKAKEWAEGWDWEWNGPDDWSLAYDYDWTKAMDSDDSMFSSYHTATRTVIHEGYYQDGYILHLKYDSDVTEPASDDRVAPGAPRTAGVLLGKKVADYAGDADFEALLVRAVEAFRKDNGELPWQESYLRLVNVYGPYSETPDELLEQFYDEDKLGQFVAVFNSGETSKAQQQAIMTRAAEDGELGYFSILLDRGVPPEEADTMLRMAYDNGDIGIFYILLEYASNEAKQDIKDQATRDGRFDFIAGIDGPPSKESIDEMINNMETLEPAMVAMVSDYLTREQAQRLAETAYEQENIAVFSIVLDYLDKNSVDAFHQRAHEDGRIDFYAITGW